MAQLIRHRFRRRLRLFQLRGTVADAQADPQLLSPQQPFPLQGRGLIIRHFRRRRRRRRRRPAAAAAAGLPRIVPHLQPELFSSSGITPA